MPRPSRQVPARRVLVVDDQREAADTLAAVLGSCGLTVHVAYDSARGLDDASWFLPDVALWDLLLPGMDGYQAARRLRASDRHGRVRLIALTGVESPDTLQRAARAGFDEFLKKPVYNRESWPENKNIEP